MWRGPVSIFACLVGVLEVAQARAEEKGHMGIEGYRKTREKMTLRGVPPGTYAARFTVMGKSLTHSATVAPGAALRLTVSFPDGKVSEAAIGG